MDSSHVVVIGGGFTGLPFGRIAAPDRFWHIAGSQACFRRMAGDPVAAAMSLLTVRKGGL